MAELGQFSNSTSTDSGNSTTGHTPVLWHKAYPFIRDLRNENVLRVVTETSFPPTRDLTPFEIDVRMNLASSAPDLLAACKLAKEYLVPDLVEPGRTVFWALVAAIAKAEGRAR